VKFKERVDYRQQKSLLTVGSGPQHVLDILLYLLIVL